MTGQQWQSLHSGVSEHARHVVISKSFVIQGQCSVHIEADRWQRHGTSAHLILSVGEGAAEIRGIIGWQRIFVAVPKADELVLEGLVADLQQAEVCIQTQAAAKLECSPKCSHSGTHVR